MKILNEFNNREIAILIWLLIFFILIFTDSKVRISLLSLIRAFLEKKILVLFVAMLFYIYLTIMILNRVSFWDMSALKDTIFWLLGTAMATFFETNKALQDNNYFKKVIIDSIKFVILIEFIINLYTFNLLVELIIVPVICLFTMISVFADSMSKYKQVKGFSDGVLGIIGIYLLIFTFREIVFDFDNFMSLKNLRDFLLPPLLSILLIPYFYFAALYMQYELFFMRIDFANKDKDLSWSIKKKILKICHINLSRLNRVSKNAGYPQVKNSEEILRWLDK